MIKWMRWLFWNAWYLAWPVSGDINTLFRSIDRTRWPWWTFKPCIVHNDTGGFWEIDFEPEGGLTWDETIQVRAIRSSDSDNRIVGLKIDDDQFAPVSQTELIRRLENNPRRSTKAPRMIYIEFRSADGKTKEAEARVFHEQEQLPEGLWSVTHEGSEACEVMSPGEMPAHWREQLIRWGQFAERVQPRGILGTKDEI